MTAVQNSAVEGQKPIDHRAGMLMKTATTSSSRKIMNAEKDQ